MKEYFQNVPKIKYEGKDTENPLAFRYYNADEMIAGKRMEDHLRFAVAYWHTYMGTGNDPFGPGTALRPWDGITDVMDLAKAKMEANFEFCEKLGAPFFCFHDRDIAPEGDTLKESNKNLDEIVKLAKELMKTSKVKVLWGTANAFSNPRYVHGASTSPNAAVFAFAAAQVKKAMEVTMELGGQNYVFWGGREGYETLLNTDMKLELDNFARFLHMAVDYAKEIGFKGQFLIEPKPKEPTKHQYDFDTATVIGFLRTYGLEKYFKMNVEANHATLATHTFQHELRMARINGMLGSIDANQGDLLLGWDTDQFPTNIYDTSLAMYEVIQAGGLTTGGLNFDSKVRRGSFEPVDLFYSHIAGMDTFAKGLKIAYSMTRDGKLDKFVRERYSSYSSGIGKDIVGGKVGFKELEEYALENDQIVNTSGRQEMLEASLNKYILGEGSNGHISDDGKVIRKQTYTYKTVGDCDIEADIYSMPDNKKHPAIIWIHGGGMTGGGRENINPERLQGYLNAGYTVVSIDYRLAPEVKLIDMIEDVTDAYNWVYEKGAASFNIDTERIALVGHSAGAYFSMSIGFRVSPRPRAIVSFYGFGDVAASWISKASAFWQGKPLVSEEEAFQSVYGKVLTNNRGGLPRGLFFRYCRQNGIWAKHVCGHDPETEPSKFIPLCPIKNVKEDFPPTLFLHGEKDGDVPYEQALLMAEQLTLNGVENKVIIVPEGEHGFDGNLQIKEAVDDVYREAMQFLDKYMR